MGCQTELHTVLMSQEKLNTHENVAKVLWLFLPLERSHSVLKVLLGELVCFTNTYGPQTANDHTGYKERCRLATYFQYKQTHILQTNITATVCTEQNIATSW